MSVARVECREAAAMDGVTGVVAEKELSLGLIDIEVKLLALRAWWSK